MVIKNIEVKEVLTKTNLPVSDYAVNPYVGCTHACKYCSMVRVEITDLTKPQIKPSIYGTCAHFLSMDHKKNIGGNPCRTY